MRTGTATPLLLAALLSGCTGFVYTHSTRPLDVDMAATPVFAARGDGDVKRIQVNLVDVQWGESGLVAAARAADLETIHYADVETFSVMGVFTRRVVHVYGE